MFEIGEHVGDVEIVARLRAGGMAALYLGRRVGAGGFSKDLAIKVIHAHLSTDSSFVEMFVDEARLSARIDHPNVVRVEALREHKGAYCLLMEFVHGCSLSQLMSALKKRDYRFSPELAVALTIRVADGLHAAHELLNPDGTPAGVVHRDVSPANVLVGYRGDVKLIDFGIAKATQRLHHTEASGLKGKIAYMSPEQAFGREVERRTDVYALGIVLWEMLTMRRLFKADNDLRLLDMVRDPKVVPPSALVPDLPRALDRVILEALSGERSRRPPTARDLRYRLLDALPSAAAIDPLQISAVICDVMRSKIDEDREILSHSSFNALPAQIEHDSVTLSRLLRPAQGAIDISVDDLAANADALAEGMGAVSSGYRSSPPTLLPHGGGDGFTPTHAPRRRRVLPLVLGIAASLGLASGAAVGLGYAVFADQDGRASAEGPRVSHESRVELTPTEAETETEAEIAEAEIAETEAEIAETEAEIAETEAEIAETEAEIAETEDTVATSAAEIRARRRRERLARARLERQRAALPAAAQRSGSGTRSTRPASGTSSGTSTGNRPPRRIITDTF